MKENFDVTGMTCSACSAHVEKSVCKLPGIKEVNVNLLQNSMRVEFDEKQLDTQRIIRAVEDAGYGASLKGAPAAAAAESKKESSADEELKKMKKRVIASVCWLIPLMYLSMGHMVGLPIPWFLHGSGNELSFAFTQLLLTTPVLILNKRYFINGFKTLFKGAPNMDSLIALGASAAMVYGIAAIYLIGFGLGHNLPGMVDHYAMNLYFESAAMIPTLISFGKYLEARSKRRTSDAISRLINLQPKRAWVIRDGQEVEIPAEELAVGDIVLVRPGQGVPVDGEIIEGHGSIDESALTGESIPVDKQAGDKVIGATINQAGFFKFRATQVGADTTLSQIVRLVEEAAGSKAPIAKLADKMSGVFVPVVIAIAIIAGAAWLIAGQDIGHALSTTISVLVISCPCALGLATPTAVMVGTGRGAEQGILIKSAESLETAHLIDTVVLDKTGTITMGKPVVTDFICAQGVTAQELLKLAASAEQPSEHPLAQAIVNRAREDNLSLLPTEDFESIPGQGIATTVQGERVLAGNLKMMREHKVELGEFEQAAQRLADEGKTPLYFVKGKRLMGLAALADVVKADSAQAISELQHMGLNVVMLTGDNLKTAQAIQKQVGVQQVVAEVLPADKERVVAKFQSEGKKVAMVGDGVNDAPALARADVGIAIGAGTDVAIESADIVLMKSSLMDVAASIQLSRAVIKNIKENLFWAFFYNSICIPIAAGLLSPIGLTINPMFGAAAMSISSVCVVSNALRLKLFKPKFMKTPAGENPSPDAHKSLSIETIEEKRSDEVMNKVMKIEGMMCSHCTGRVDKALNAIDGVSAKVSLEDKCAYLTLSKEVSDQTLTQAVVDAGYEVVSIQ